MKYKIRVKVMAACEYEVEVEHSTESKAEDEACASWRDNMPSDFQVDKGYITDTVIEQTEQLTWECVECEKEITEAIYRENDEMCVECFNVAEAEEALRTAQRIQRAAHAGGAR